MNQIEGNEFDHHEIIDNGAERNLGFRFKLNFLLQRQFHSKIRNAKADRRKWFEGGTTIRLPRRGDCDKVVIKGNTEEEVVSAKLRLIKFLSPRPRLTHFLSVVFTTDEIKKNFVKFRDEVINESGLHPSLFQKPEKLHVTIIVMSLPSLTDQDKARECLTPCKEMIIDPILNGKPLAVTVKGVSVFSDRKPTATNVLFGNVESAELQEISNKIAKHFADQGLFNLHEEDVKLHLTMINTTFFKPDKNGEHEQPGGGREDSRRRRHHHGRFDATQILEKYKDFYFGSLTLNEVQINIMGSKGDDGFYLSIESLKF